MPKTASTAERMRAEVAEVAEVKVSAAAAGGTHRRFCVITLIG
jgi:hypothetical protein